MALDELPEDQRVAVILIGASGFSYEEAAEICDCAVGTMKSRVSRARARLQDLLQVGGEGDYGPDAISTQVTSGPPLSSPRCRGFPMRGRWRRRRAIRLRRRASPVW